MDRLPEREFHPLKILHHFDRLQALASDREIAPVTVEIDPVAYCNHACDWCVDPVHQAQTMLPDTYDALIRELADYSIDGHGAEGIVFKGGGEPTLHGQFGQMLKRAADLGFAVGVVTNGSRLTRWAKVLAAHASYVRVSMDGPTADSHALIHRSQDFSEILEGVDRLMQARGGRRTPVVGLSFAMDIRTVALAQQAIRLGERLAVDYVLLRPPFFEEVGRVATMLPAEAELVRQRLRAAAAEYAGDLMVMVANWIGDAEHELPQAQTPGPAGRRAHHMTADVPAEHRTRRCWASPLLAVVTADGSLYGCCNLRSLPEWSFGQLDYGKGIGFAQLWTASPRRSILARMQRTVCLPHCTHPLSRYNDIIELLRDAERPHSQFV
jgi:organic radical activating enzyme